MQPVLWDGDFIQIQPQKTLKSGDIALFTYLDEGQLAHRVIAVTEEVFYCKGDNAFRIEEVPSDVIVGKVVGRYTEQGWSSCCFRSRLISRLVCYLSEKINQQTIKANWDVAFVRKCFPYKFLQWLLKQRILYSTGKEKTGGNF